MSVIFIAGLPWLSCIRAKHRVGREAAQVRLVSNAVRDIKANVNAMHRSMKDVAMATTVTDLEAATRIVDQYEELTFEASELVSERFLGDLKVIRDEVITLSRHRAFELSAPTGRAGCPARGLRQTRRIGRNSEHIDWPHGSAFFVNL